MAADPCSVCGGTDVNLIDGFYYCVECGTQDVNARETVVESTMLADGTFALASTRKFKTVIKDGLEMSGEWHKWHTYNFILVGLTDELIALGAKPTVKLKVLWVWSKYIKKFQDKEKMGVSFGSQSVANFTVNASTIDDEEENGCEKKSKEADAKNSTDKEMEKALKDLKLVSKGLLVSILYIALNLDKSNIQLSHILRYIREGRLSFMDCSKFIPKELDTSKIPYWLNFLRCTREPTPNFIRKITMSLYKGLNLGTPLVPDLRKLIDNYAAELCLPDDFKNLVFSLMNLVPCDFLDIDLKSQKTLIRVPDFEVTCMSYVLIALKMCFGLDCDYEVRLSEIVDKINEEENFMKSHRLGTYSLFTDRLFSFREWSNYLQFRKMVLCKHYLPMAHQHEFEVDDHVFMEQSMERPQRKKKLRDEVTMDILNRIILTDDDDVRAIPTNEFKPTLTPMSTYTQVIIEYIQDPELKVLLSEDFTQYSLKYACGGMNLHVEEKNLFTGINELNKTTNKNIVGTLVSKKADLTMVYVRNCENKNWLKTKPPSMKHIVKLVEEESADSSSESIENSNKADIKCSPEEVMIKSNIMDETESSVTDCTIKDPETESLITNSTVKDTEEKEFEGIEEEKAGISIFDDSFTNLENEEKPDMFGSEPSRGISFAFEDEPVEHETNINHANDEWDVQSDVTDFNLQFNPETFNRERTIKELILFACKKYRIPVPPEYEIPRKSRKRKSALVHDVAESESKQRKIVNRCRPGEHKREVDKILAEYNDALKKDVLNKVSDHVNTVVKNLGLDEFVNSVDNDNNAEQHNKKDEEIRDQDESNVNLDAENNETISSKEYPDDEINIEEILPKSHPNFDEKTHDIRQLYIKFNEQFNVENLLCTDDPEIDKILSKQLEKSSLDEVNSDLESEKSEDDLSDSEDVDNNEEYERMLMEAKNKQLADILEPVLKDVESMKEFKYWFRHYHCKKVTKNLDMKKFDSELTENFPPSFTLVIHECASILGCTAYTLYKKLQDIEQILMSRCK